jgi:zinc protease
MILQEKTTYRTVLDNGIVIITSENSAADIIAARLFFRAGGRWENQDKAGVFHLLSSVLTKGTQKLSSHQIADIVESIGASLGTDSTSDYFLVNVKTVSTDFPEILKLAAELLRSPSFPSTQVELEKRLTLNDIRAQKEQPFNIAFEQLRNTMYADHPYSFSSLGTEETVAKLTREDLESYHQKYFRPDNLVISIAGRISMDDAVEMVTKIFGDWEIPTEPLPLIKLPEITPHPQTVISPLDTQQSIIMLGYLTPNVNHEDYGTLKLLNTYLGNGLSSRLFVELREKRGLAYEVSAFYPTRLDQSQFAVYMGTAPDNTETAFQGLKFEVDRLCETRLTADELLASKNKLLGQYALGKQTNAQMAQIFGWYEILGLGIDFDTRFQTLIAHVTTEMCQNVANKYFHQPYISVVGPESQVNEIMSI